MQSFNAAANAIFDVLMAPFGHRPAAFDLLVWPLVMGIVALQSYKYVSNQGALARVKSQIAMHLLEIRLFSHDILQVLKSTGAILMKNVFYLGNHMLPMAVMLVPMVVVMAQLVANYAYAPSPVGAVELLKLELDPNAKVGSHDVALELPAGVALDAPAVETADGRVFWRLRAEQPGDHLLHVRVGGEAFDKSWAVGGEARKVPLKRLRGLEAVLYPAEPAIPGDAPLRSLELVPLHTRELSFFPDGEFGIVLWFVALSLAAGFALRGLFGVTF
jgi:hypothetical protein